MVHKASVRKDSDHKDLTHQLEVQEVNLLHIFICGIMSKRVKSNKASLILLVRGLLKTPVQIRISKNGLTTSLTRSSTSSQIRLFHGLKQRELTVRRQLVLENLQELSVQTLKNGLRVKLM